MYLIILVFHSFLLNLFISYPSVRCTYSRTPNLQIREICARARTYVHDIQIDREEVKSSFVRLFRNRLTRIDRSILIPTDLKNQSIDSFFKSVNQIRFSLKIPFSQNVLLSKSLSRKISFSQNPFLAKSFSQNPFLAKSFSQNLIDLSQKFLLVRM